MSRRVFVFVRTRKCQTAGRINPCLTGGGHFPVWFLAWLCISLSCCSHGKAAWSILYLWTNEEVNYTLQFHLSQNPSVHYEVNNTRGNRLTDLWSHKQEKQKTIKNIHGKSEFPFWSQVDKWFFFFFWIGLRTQQLYGIQGCGLFAWKVQNYKEWVSKLLQKSVLAFKTERI